MDHVRHMPMISVIITRPNGDRIRLHSTEYNADDDSMRVSVASVAQDVIRSLDDIRESREPVSVEAGSLFRSETAAISLMLTDARHDGIGLALEFQAIEVTRSVPTPDAFDRVQLAHGVNIDVHEESDTTRVYAYPRATHAGICISVEFDTMSPPIALVQDAAAMVAAARARFDGVEAPALTIPPAVLRGLCGFASVAELEGQHDRDEDSRAALEWLGLAPPTTPPR